MKSPANNECLPIQKISDYSIVDRIYESDRTVVYRAVEDRDKRAVIIKLMRHEDPSSIELAQFCHQYAIANHLSSAGIVRPIALKPWQNTYILVMEDCGSSSLRDYLREHSLSLGEILEIAIQMATILHDLARDRAIHKDIKPANILIHPATKQLKLIDFGITSLLPKETLEIKTPNGLEGTLAYIAPEQTGRMNRGVDYRADFYSLGVTLFELFTGQLPFSSADPMELVYCHLAKQPPSPSSLHPKLPLVLSEIVGKLMAKNAEDRYQSALGLKYDLELCLSQWQATTQITNFAIASRDRCDRFSLSEKLYGRELEVQTLLDAFDRVANGGTEVIIVAGFSGIGKTAVVNEVHKPITRQHGYFIKGKFDQFNRNMPFAAFAQAFRQLMTMLLASSDAELQSWKTQILAALGHNARVIIEVIPELERIVGQQPSAPVLSGSAAQNRFYLLFQKFVSVFTTPAHPLTIFVDDLQWADLASLKLMQLLMAERLGTDGSPVAHAETRQSTGHLLIIGAYRDNEVFPTHPAILTLERIGAAGVQVKTIELTPLELDSVNQLIADTLSWNQDLAQPVTELVYTYTKGNPFLTTQLLKALHQDGSICFDLDTRSWQCELDRVQISTTLTDDIVQLMTQQLYRLPESTQTLLKLAACIGDRFDLQTLKIVSERMSSIEITTDLWPALQEGLILPIGQAFNFLPLDGLESLPLDASISYKFLHDRVQQAAYALITEDRKQATHLKIGQLLLNNASASEREARLFAIVNHLNASVSSFGLSVAQRIADPQEREQLAELNLAAGRKAKAATAYSSAIDYLAMGISLLPTTAWESHYALMLNLHVEIAEATYLNIDFDRLEQWVNVLLQQAKTLPDRIKVQQIRIVAVQIQGRLLEAIEIGLEVLSGLGIEFPAQPTQADIGQAFGVTRVLWANKQPLELLDLPTMVDPQMLAVMAILTRLVSSAYVAAPNLMPLLIFKQLELSLQFGNCPVSIFTYADYGVVLCGIIGDIENGYEFGELALSLLDRYQLAEFQSRSWYIVYSYIKHWKMPVAQFLGDLQEAYSSGIEAGDIESACLNVCTYCCYSYYLGQDLTQLKPTIDAWRQTIERYKQFQVLNILEIYQQTVVNLLGESEVPYLLFGEIFDRTSLSEIQASNRQTTLFVWYLNQSFLYYLFGQDDEAATISTQTADYLDGGVAMFKIPIYVWMDALIQLNQYAAASPSARQSILDRVEAHQTKLAHWAKLSPENHQHRWELVSAERAQVLGNPADAMDAYDRSINLAQAQGFIQDEALANELAAKFYLARGNTKVATAYVQAAYDCYAQWGATAKTHDLEQRYPDLLRPLQRLLTYRHSDPNSSKIENSQPSIDFTLQTNSVASDRIDLDFTAIFKASQGLSGTIELQDLLHQLTQIILHNSGGDFCALLLPNWDEQWQLVAAATPEGIDLNREPLDGNSQLPVKLIQYVKNTQAVVVIDNLDTDLLVIDDYLNQQQPKSLLCLPLIDRGNLTGVVYLHNRSTSSVFTPDRLQVLNLLCTQAAISLKNAQLFAERKQTEAQLQATNAELLRANRLKDEFLATMSHELRTPLNAILGMTEGLQAEIFGAITERQFKALDTIERSGNHLLVLINDILDVAKIEAGQLQLDRTSIAVAPLCNSSLTFIQSQALSKQITIETQLPTNLPQLWIEERRIRQVLINLLSNAVKFTPTGGKITLAALDSQALNSDASDAEPGGSLQDYRHQESDAILPNYLRISVIDTGIGIAPEYLQQIFQPFIQVDSKLNRKYEGTGLGLVLVKRIVELHGGSVRLTSQVDVGSCFSIDLPCVPSELALPTSIAQPTQTQSRLIWLLATEHPGGTSGTIYSYLQAKGYRVAKVDCGGEIVELNSSIHPDLILLDLDLPAPDGDIHPLQQIRSHATWPDLPIVALTPGESPADSPEERLRQRELYLSAGATECLSKPLKLKQLMTTIERLLAHKLQ